jgi:hypothetical protein
MGDKMLGLQRMDGSLAEDPSKVEGMLACHFQNIFLPCALTN